MKFEFPQRSTISRRKMLAALFLVFLLPGASWGAINMYRHLMTVRVNAGIVGRTPGEFPTPEEVGAVTKLSATLKQFPRKRWYVIAYQLCFEGCMDLEMRYDRNKSQLEIWRYESYYHWNDQSRPHPPPHWEMRSRYPNVPVSQINQIAESSKWGSLRKW